MTSVDTSRAGHTRGLDLLWGTGERPSRGPKPGLSLDRIARAAIEVADAEGLTALSMRRVAEHLGVTTMALYRYVPGKTELLAVMLDMAIGAPPRLDGHAGGWRVQLERWARETWAFFHRHPWALQVVTGHRPMGPHEMGWVEAGLRVLDGTGLTDHERVDTVLLVNGYVRGAAQLSRDQNQAEQGVVVTAARWWSTYAPLLQQFANADRYPTLRSIAASDVFAGSAEDGPADGLEFGLQRVLDGIEAFVQARAASARTPPRGSG